MDYRIGIARIPELSHLFGTELLFIDCPGLDVTVLDDFSEQRLINKSEIVYGVNGLSTIVPRHSYMASRSFPSYSSTRYLRDITKNQKNNWISKHPNPSNPGCRIFIDLSTFRNSKGYTHRAIIRQRKKLSRKLISESCIIGSIALIDNTMSLGLKLSRYIWLKGHEIGSICKLLFQDYPGFYDGTN